MPMHTDVPQSAGSAKRVLFVDHWTKGINNFSRLVPELARRGYSYDLLHMGCFKGNAKPEEVVQGIKCFNVSRFNNLRFHEAIARFRPSLILGLNMHTFGERVAYTYARGAGIPAIYLQHGALMEPQLLKAFATQFDKRLRPWAVVGMLRKNAYLVKSYLQLPARSLSSVRLAKVLYSHARNPSGAMLGVPAARELWADSALVYNRSVAERLTAMYGMPPDRIVVVGNPELDAAVERSTAPLSGSAKVRLIRQIGLDPEKPIIFYPDEGFGNTGVFGWTRQSTAEYLIQLHQAAAQVGAQLLIRPRASYLPGEFWNEKSIKDLFAEKPGCVVSRDLSIVDSLSITSVAVGTISTVLESAVVMQVPIAVLAWHVGDAGVMVSPFARFGAGLPVHTQRELPSALSSLIDSRVVPDRSTYIAERLGPLSGTSVARVVDEIDRLVSCGSRYGTYA